MDFEIPAELAGYLAELDEFIEREIRPLEQQDDNIRFFDHRREDARTDWDRGGLPSREWEALLRRGGAPGGRCRALPVRVPGRSTAAGTAPTWAWPVIREHLASKGLGLHCDLQNEHMIVGNNVGLLLMLHYGTPEQRAEWAEELAAGRKGFAFGITEPAHGSDATFMETTAMRDGDGLGDQRGEDMEHRRARRLARPDLRPHQRPARRRGRDHRVPDAGGLARLHRRGVPLDVQHADRPRPHHASATSACRTARSSAARDAACRWCSISSTRTGSGRPPPASGRPSTASTSRSPTPQERKPFGKPLAANQAIQFPLVELQTQCEMLRALIHKTAWLMDTHGPFSASDKVSMCNYWANRLCCEAADRAMQVHGGLGYSRHKPFEHIYRHHRRYRITEGTEEIQMRRVAGYMFGLHAPARAQGRERES